MSVNADELYEAIKNKDEKKVSELLEHPENIAIDYIKDAKEGQTFLSLAIKSGNKVIIDKVLSHPAIDKIIDRRVKIEATTEKEKALPYAYPLKIAASLGDKELIEKLLNKGAMLARDLQEGLSDKIKEQIKPVLIKIDNFLKLDKAIKDKNKKTSRDLIEQNSFLNYHNLDGDNLLYVALVNDQFEIAELLLEKGIDPSIKDGNNCNFLVALAAIGTDTLTYNTSYSNYIKGSFSRLWEKLNPQVGLKCLQEFNNLGHTPLHAAVQAGSGVNAQFLMEVIELIPVEKWLPLFNQKSRDDDSKTVFQSLIEKKQFDVLKKAFEKMDKTHQEDKLQLIYKGGTESLLNLVSKDKKSIDVLFFLLKEIPDISFRKNYVLNPDDITKGILYEYYNTQDWAKVNEILEACGLPKITDIMYKTSGDILAILSKDEYFPEFSKAGKEAEVRFTEKVKAKSTQEAFTRGDAAALTQKFKDTISETRKDPLLLYGPLVKSQHTVDLEKIAKYILEGKKVNIDISSGVCVVKVVLDDRTESYNLTEIMKFANLQHVVLNQEDMKRYAEYVKTKSKIKPYLPSSYGYPTESDFNKKDEKGTLSDLSYSEKIALNIWSGPDNAPMWDLLNGNFGEISTYERDPSEILVHCVMAASGMNKIPDTTIHYTYRWETAESKFALDRKAQRIAASKEGGILMERSFVSTSYEEPSETFYRRKQTNVGIFYTEGIIGKNISSISQFPREREFLLPPTQVQFLEHIHEQSKEGHEMDFFKCKTVRTLTSLPEEAQIAATSIPEEELNRLKEELAKFQTSIVDLEAELKKKNYDPVFITLINKLNKETELLMNRADMDPFAKLKKIEEKLNVTIKEIEEMSISLDDELEEEKKVLNEILREKKSELTDKQIKHEINMQPKSAPPITFYSKFIAGSAKDKEKNIVKEAQKFNDPKTTKTEKDTLKKELGLKDSDEVLKVEENMIQVKHSEKEVKWHDIQFLYDMQENQRKFRPE